MKRLAILILVAACGIAPVATPTTTLSATTTPTVTTLVAEPMTTQPAPTTAPTLATTSTTLPPRPTLPEVVVGGLVVSMGEPPADVVERYADFGGNVIMLWEAEEAQYWPDYPAIVWATGSGGQVNDPLRKLEPDQPPLELARNVVAVQVVDEPMPEAMSDHPLYKPVPQRLGLPVGEFTNFSYWSPYELVRKSGGSTEPYLNEMLAKYQGDRVMMSEYNLVNIHLDILAYFRRKALEMGLPYWQYLNSYSGYETGMQPVHSPSDLAWSAFAGAVMGYSGHIWFAYQFGSVGHDEAIQGGGSVLYEAPGEWTETPNWQIVADINQALLAFSQRLAPMTSTEVCWGGGCGFSSSQRLVVGSFVDESGQEWWGILNSNHSFTGSEESATVTMPFDALVCSPLGDCNQVPEDGQVTLAAGWPVLVTQSAQS